MRQKAYLQIGKTEMAHFFLREKYANHASRQQQQKTDIPNSSFKKCFNVTFCF
jgi:hypothetical protein